MNTPRGWASTLAVILFVGGMQLLVLGVMGEYIARIHDEVKQRPLYIVREEIGALGRTPVAGERPRRG